MPSKKIFIIMSDGPGLRNFAYTNFHQQARDRGYQVIFWNMTPFDLAAMGYDEIKIENPRIHLWTHILKVLRVRFEIALNIRKTGDEIYKCYLFPLSYRSARESVKNILIEGLFRWFRPQNGLNWVRTKTRQKESQTPYFRHCLETLRREKPDLVFSTNQRTVLAIAPIIAAQKLGIPTATFIFSWDNLPKATMALEPDYYLVWSRYMKDELRFYYDYIPEDSIKITGTPQFEPHTYKHLLMSRGEFFTAHGLDPDKKYICFSGDDITTSPFDHQYLADLAAAVRKLNAQGGNLGIVFRRCPVDFSERYDAVLREFADIVVPVNPKWLKLEGRWNGILPTEEDLKLQINTIAHTECVVNLGSSMVFDYASFSKPCVFVSYDGGSVSKCRSVESIYKYVHFRSMPDASAVRWVSDPAGFEKVIAEVVASDQPVDMARKWFEIVNLHPADAASSRILDTFDEIMKTHGRNS